MNYKSFGKQWIGGSDAAFLTFVGSGDDGVYAQAVKFGGDGEYNAYIIYGDDVEIGAHYKRVATFGTWLKIYDDDGRTFRHHEYGATYNVYRAGDYGCIVQIISKAQAQ